jgi:hypothetical protein
MSRACFVAVRLVRRTVAVFWPAFLPSTLLRTLAFLIILFAFVVLSSKLAHSTDLAGKALELSHSLAYGVAMRVYCPPPPIRSEISSSATWGQQGYSAPHVAAHRRRHTARRPPIRRWGRPHGCIALRQICLWRLRRLGNSHFGPLWLLSSDMPGTSRKRLSPFSSRPLPRRYRQEHFPK